MKRRNTKIYPKRKNSFKARTSYLHERWVALMPDTSRFEFFFLRVNFRSSSPLIRTQHREKQINNRLQAMLATRNHVVSRGDGNTDGCWLSGAKASSQTFRVREGGVGEGRGKIKNIGPPPPFFFPVYLVFRIRNSF